MPGALLFSQASWAQESHQQQDQVSGPSDLGPSQQLPESWPHAWGVSEILGQLSGLCPGSLGLFLHSPKGVHVL